MLTKLLSYVSADLFYIFTNMYVWQKVSSDVTGQTRRTTIYAALMMDTVVKFLKIRAFWLTYKQICSLEILAFRSMEMMLITFVHGIQKVRLNCACWVLNILNKGFSNHTHLELYSCLPWASSVYFNTSWGSLSHKLLEL